MCWSVKWNVCKVKRGETASERKSERGMDRCTERLADEGGKRTLFRVTCGFGQELEHTLKRGSIIFRSFPSPQFSPLPSLVFIFHFCHGWAYLHTYTSKQVQTNNIPLNPPCKPTPPSSRFFFFFFFWEHTTFTHPTLAIRATPQEQLLLQS